MYARYLKFARSRWQAQKVNAVSLKQVLKLGVGYKTFILQLLIVKELYLQFAIR